MCVEEKINNQERRINQSIQASLKFGTCAFVNRKARGIFYPSILKEETFKRFFVHLGWNITYQKSNINKWFFDKSKHLMINWQITFFWNVMKQQPWKLIICAQWCCKFEDAKMKNQVEVLLSNCELILTIQCFENGNLTHELHHCEIHQWN